MKKGFCFGASLALLISLAAFPALAQAPSYPGQPIQMVIPMAPGDTVDLTGRAIATEMAKILNTPVVPVNKAGGGGAIGADSVAKAKKEVVDYIKVKIGPIALPKEVYLVEDLPKTRSGKIMRRILKAKDLGLPVGDTSTLEEY